MAILTHVGFTSLSYWRLQPAHNPLAAILKAHDQFTTHRLFKFSGKGVTIYILDSGIRAAHQEFQAWSSHDTSGPGASRAVPGPDYIDNDGVADDCDG
jgi:subtilisin family serine protease